MVTIPTLYAHQTDMVNRLRLAIRRHRAAILAAEPGVGKTRMAKHIIGSAINREPNENQSGRSLFAVYGRNLVDNACGSFAEEPELPHGKIMSGANTNWSHRCQVGSIDTLLSWYCDEDTYNSSITYDLIIYDETHAHFAKFRKFLTRHDTKRKELGLHPAAVVGLSATPSAKGLGDVFGEIVTGPSTQWLIEHQFLSPFRYFRATSGRLEKLELKGQRYTDASLHAAFDGLGGDMVRDWKKYGQGRPTIGFFARRSHAKDAQQILNANGIKAEYVDGETDDWKRQSLFKSLAMGHYDYLCNVGIVERGTNIPAVSCIQFCTAIGSLNRFRQMLGRGSRTCEGKTDTIVIDHGGNVGYGKFGRHGFFEDEVDWVLDVERGVTAEHKTRPTVECPFCSAVYRGGRCNSCDYEPTPKELKKQGLEFDGSEVVEIKPKERAKPKAQSSEKILISALYAAAHKGMTWQQAYFIARSNAKKMGVEFTVPRTFEVAGKTYMSIARGDSDGRRRVTHLFDFLKARKATA